MRPPLHAEERKWSPNPRTLWLVAVVALSDLGLGRMDQQHTPGLSNGKTRDGEEEYRVYLFAPESWFYTTLLAFDNVFLTSI